MDLLAIECFLAIVDLGSFTLAAKQVKRTQSAVTQKISNLEKILNSKLFIRGRQVTLTKEGELFQYYARKLQALNQELLDRFKNPEIEGEVRFGVPEDFATLFLSDVLIDFARIHPRVFLSVECDLTLNLFNGFKKGAFDLVLVKMSSAGDFPQGVEVWKEPLVWVGKQGNMLPDATPLPVVFSPEPCVYRSSALQALEEEGLRWRIVYTSPSYAGTIAAVKAGMGITALPITMIPQGLKRIEHPHLPSLPEIHVSLLKQGESHAVQSMNDFLLKKLMFVKSKFSWK